MEVGVPTEATEFAAKSAELEQRQKQEPAPIQYHNTGEPDALDPVLSRPTATRRDAQTLSAAQPNTPRGTNMTVGIWFTQTAINLTAEPVKSCRITVWKEAVKTCVTDTSAASSRAMFTQ